MSATHQAVKILLENVWYAEPFIGEVRADFDAIDEAASQIAPSDSERFRVELARHLQTQSGGINLAGLWTLDAGNRKRAIVALRLFSGDINFLEPKPLVEQLSDYLDTR